MDAEISMEADIPVDGVSPIGRNSDIRPRLVSSVSQ